MKCAKCGRELREVDGDCFECKNGLCDWVGWVLTAEMAVILATQDKAFDQYQQSLSTVVAIMKEQADDLVYLTDICRFVTGDFLERNNRMSNNDADTINQIAQFVVAYDKR